MKTVETDYLIIGGGAVGMVFADSLIAESDADVVIVDHRHRPGGHWNDAYPFVRLHQPSAFYGVNSRVLGSDSIDTVGPNAGFYERATAAEICDYFQRVLEEHLLPSGQVRFYGLCDYVGDWSNDHRFVSRLTGEESIVRVRRKLVDARYLEPSVPSTHRPGYEVDPNVRLIPVNDLVALTEPGSGYTVIGAGKTGMDACTWLLDSGVPAEVIRWVMPRDSWVLDRAITQPLESVGAIMEAFALQLEAAAQAESVEELFRALEERGSLHRLDPEVEPSMYHCAVLSQDEIRNLRLIEDVVRQGRVTRIGSDRIDLEAGSVASDRDQVYVDCTASALNPSPVRPVFEPGRITPQQVRTCQPGLSTALAAFVECHREEETAKSRLFPAHPLPDRPLDWLSVTAKGQRIEAAWAAEPDIAAWLEGARLNFSRGVADRLADPAIQVSVGRIFENRQPAIENLETLLAETAQTCAPA
jgi:hypothetical protein